MATYTRRFALLSVIMAASLLSGCSYNRFVSQEEAVKAIPFAPGRVLELSGDILVGPRSGLCPVPRAAVGIELRIGDLRERAVHVLALLE